MYEQEAYGLNKVLIYDFDLHHGKGKQDIFYDDPDILFISHHQAGIFPGTGDSLEVGEGDGEGSTINIPLPGDSGSKWFIAVFVIIIRVLTDCHSFAGEHAVQSIFNQILVPAEQRFQARSR